MDESSTLMSPLQVLHFYLQDVYACIDLKYIERVLPLVQVEPLPASPAYFVGLMNFAGDSIPVIDLAWRLQLNCTQPYSLDIPILLCTDGNRRVGFVIDKILGIDTVEKNFLQKEFSDESSPFFATIHINSKLSLLLNMEHVMNINYSSESTAKEMIVKPKL